MLGLDIKTAIIVNSVFNMVHLHMGIVNKSTGACVPMELQSRILAWITDNIISLAKTGKRITWACSGGG